MEEASKMVSLRNKVCFLALFVIIHLPFSCCSTNIEALPAFIPKNDNIPKYQLNSKMTYEVTVHGVLLWASLGVLTPMGILIIRLSNRDQTGTRHKLYFYFHIIVQILAVGVATAGAIKSIKTFENSFSNGHQRIGLALYCAIWVQALIGCCRPHRGTKQRRLWYFLHWIYGTMVCIMGILNIYTGLGAYKKKTNTNVTLWTILFTVQISLMAFFYLLQDKWDYMQKQGISLREQGGQIRPSDDEQNSQRNDNDDNNNNNKDLWREPCSKVNALKNLFH